MSDPKAPDLKADGRKTRARSQVSKRQLSLPAGVRADLHSGRLVLRGWIESYESKRALETQARASGYGEVENRLRISPVLAGLNPMDTFALGRLWP